jgi:hypothetical protein
MKSLDKARARLRARLARTMPLPAARRGRVPPQVEWLNALHEAARRASWPARRRLN